MFVLSVFLNPSAEAKCKSVTELKQGGRGGGGGLKMYYNSDRFLRLNFIAIIDIHIYIFSYSFMVVGAFC